MISANLHGTPRLWQRGATLAEFVVVVPTLLLMALATMQAALVFYAKSNLNYAAFEAARAGAVANASIASVTAAFQKALIPYYGGGRTEAELAGTAKRVADDFGKAPTRIEILSPTKESFDDYQSPALQKLLKTSARVLPNSAVGELACPRERGDCDSDPGHNKSGQSLADANLLKLRITWGIPQEKQLPLVGRFYTWALDKLGAGSGDATKQALIEARRIPLVTHVTLRMQSDAIENTAMASTPGPGNQGKPVDPGSGAGTGGGSGGELPPCPFWDTTCATCPNGLGKPPCTVQADNESCPGGECPVCKPPSPTTDPKSDNDLCKALKLNCGGGA